MKTNYEYYENCSPYYYTNIKSIECDGSFSIDSTKSGDCGPDPFEAHASGEYKLNDAGTDCKAVGTYWDTTNPTPVAYSGQIWCAGGTGYSNKTTYIPVDTCSGTVEYLNEASPTYYPSTPPEYGDFPECGEPANVPYAYFYKNPRANYITSKSQSKFRFSHYPTVSCFLKVWVRKVIQKYKWEDCGTGFSEAVVDCEESPCYGLWVKDGPDTHVDMSPYVWNPTSSSPCISNTERPVNSCDNRVFSDPVELTADENASIIIEYKFSYIKDYEPNWPDENGSQGCKPNGYPIPNPDNCPDYSGS